MCQYCGSRLDPEQIAQLQEEMAANAPIGGHSGISQVVTLATLDAAGVSAGLQFDDVGYAFPRDTGMIDMTAFTGQDSFVFGSFGAAENTGLAAMMENFRTDWAADRSLSIASQPEEPAATEFWTYMSEPSVDDWIS